MEGVSAGDVIGTPLRAEDGTSLGRVSDLVVGPDGRIEAVVVSSGGSEASVPWNAIRADDGTLVVAAGARPTGFAPPTGSWRAAAVMERMVSIQDGRPYGVVSDLVFDGDGALRQVLVTPDATEGVRYPVDHPFQEIGADYVPGLGPGSVDD
jgi:sporulation protein YlmC with PRC-barrel domain